MGTILDLNKILSKSLVPLPFLFSIFSFPFFLIWYPLSFIPYPLSIIPYPLSLILYLLSFIPYPLYFIFYLFSTFPYSLSLIYYPLFLILILACRIIKGQFFWQFSGGKQKVLLLMESQQYIQWPRSTRISWCCPR